MANTKTITLAGSPLEVPMLPIRLNKIAYPICQKLVKDNLLARVLEGQGQVDCSAEEMDDLTELAFVAAQAAHPQITREEFDNWPISPPELVDCFFLLRYQTGAWVEVEPRSVAPGDQEGEDQSGEAQGAEALPT